MFDIKPNQIIAITENGFFCGDRLIELRNKISAELTQKKLVFAMCRNSIGSLAGYIAFIETGHVPVMLDATIDVEMFDALVETYRPNYFWCPTEFAANVKYNFEKIIDFEDYILLKNMNSVVIPMHPELALLLTTSGSTGSPKFVRLTYKNIESNARSIIKYLEISDIDRPITSLPMYYSYGLSVINSHLLKNAVILLTDKSIVSKDFWKFFTEQNATSIAGVPYTYQIIKQFRLLRQELPSLHTLTQAGGKLSAELVAEFAGWAKKNGRRFVVMYGQTEATARMSYLPWKKASEKSASIGVAIPGGEFSIIDSDGNFVKEAYTQGELIYRGDNVSMGYAECPDDLVREDDNHGVLHTGDIAQRDEDGYYYIIGRLKRFIKIFGNRVNLDQAELLAKQITLDCACTGLDDKLIIHITDVSLSSEIQNYVSAKTGLHPSAINIHVVKEIPKNSSGKTQYSLLQ